MRTKLLSVWLAATALAIGAPVPAQAQVTSVNGQIAYVVCGPGLNTPFNADQCDIWVMDPDGTGQTNLTNTPDRNEVSPAWSLDGTRIACFEGWSYLYGSSEAKLMGMDANGANRTEYATTTTYPYVSTPTWSPGGAQIAFVRYADIVVVDLTTGSETTISRPASFRNVLLDADEFEPAWSPDGGKIAFVGVRDERYPDPITGTPTQGAQYEIAIVNPDGSDEQIISAGDPGTDRANYLEEDRAPAWSPDGSMVVFMSQAQVPSCCGPWQIWAVNRDGSGATNLTNDPAVNELWPSWSPDGTQIVFSRSAGTGFDLYTMPAPTSLPLTATAGAATLLQGGTTLPATIAANGATALTTDGKASNPDWGRNPYTPPPDGQQYTLFVSVLTEGKGAGGSVTSQPAGISCGRDCSEPYASGTLVTLTATPKKGTVFIGWAGPCAENSGSTTCTVTMNDVRMATATFAKSR